MQFRKFMLDDYLNGSDGEVMYRFFSNLGQHYAVRESDRTFYSTLAKNTSGHIGYLTPAFDARLVRELDFDGCEFADIDEFCNDMKSSFTNPDDCRVMQQAVPIMSMELYLRYPEFAFPYLLPRHYYKLSVVCSEFGIELPEVPPATDHVGGFKFYFDICRAMYQFRTSTGMTPVEMLVFFYGYAMRFVDEILRTSKLRNQKVYMVFGHDKDRDIYLDKGVTRDDITCWQGSPHIQPGDVVLLYEIAPVSAFTSVWQAVSPGFVDPFYARSETVFISDHVEIPPIKPTDLLKRNREWEAPCRAHMQNQWKAELSPAQYESLLAEISSTDPSFDLSTLPPVPKSVDYDRLGLNVEHDVELKLLEPLLDDLGFSRNDWVAQFIIRIGRENTSRPDYVVHLDQSGAVPRAEFVFEAKLSIPTKRQLRKDYGQAVAYADLLHSRVTTLVAREGVWIFVREDGDFPMENAKYYEWDRLRERGVMAEVREIFK